MDNPTVTIINNIAKNLSAWMEAKPELDTVQKVSERSGVGFGTVRRTKNGEGNPTITSLQDIARAFGRPLEQLIAQPNGLKVQELQAEYTVEPISPDRLRNELIKLLAAMDTDDQEVWLVTIKSAANKARKAKEEEERKVSERTTPDPAHGRRHA